MSASPSYGRRINGSAFGIGLAASYALAVSCLASWAALLGFTDLPFPAGFLSFWLFHLVWLASIVLMFRRFGKRGALSLVPVPLFLVPIAFVGMLFAACNAGSCV